MKTTTSNPRVKLLLPLVALTLLISCAVDGDTHVSDLKAESAFVDAMIEKNVN